MQTIPIPLLIQILEQYFVRRSGKRRMTDKFLALDAHFKTSINSKWEIFEDHSFPGLESYEIPVLQPSGYRSFPPAQLRGLGIISYSLWLVDINQQYGGFLCCYSPTTMSKSANLKWNETTDRMEIMPYGGNCAFVAYDNTGFPPGPQLHDVARIVGNVAASDIRMDIMRAGDVTLLDDRFLKPGKDSDATLPTASATYRGKMIRVEGGVGVADQVCVCVKRADDTYGWFDLISGAFV